VTPPIRLYGEVGRGSFAQVTDGVRRALEHHGLLAGFVSVRSHFEESDEPGANAPIAVICGSPGNIDLAHKCGVHHRRWFMLAPNSEGLAPKFAASLCGPSDVNPNIRMVDGILAVSAWAKTVLDRALDGKLPVLTCPHGVSPVFRVHEELRKQAARDWVGGRLRVLHITSTETRRKGTGELIRAWAKLCEGSPAWGMHAKLVILANPMATEDFRRVVRKAGLRPEQVTVAPGFGQLQEEVRCIYSMAHVVAQPSRSEGFGCVPLESLACGVPVIATTATGHSQWIRHDDDPRPGVVVCPHQDVHEECEDYKGATCPGIRMEDVVEALVEAREDWGALSPAAIRAASALGEEWAWEKVTETALRTVVQRCEQGF
jgi:glycosyltransferase involved in cell wall biosynthesis